MIVIVPSPGYDGGEVREVCAIIGPFIRREVS